VGGWVKESCGYTERLLREGERERGREGETERGERHC